MQTLEAPSVYAQWAHQPVVLHIVSADSRVSLRSIILSETEDTVRLRVDDDLEIDIYKHMILAVEDESWMDLIT